MSTLETFAGLHRVLMADLPLERRCDLILNLQWSQEFSGRQVQMLARYAKIWMAEAGSTIVKEGAREGYMCLILAGRVKVFKKNEHGGSQHLATLGRGQTFGEMSLVDGEPRSASVVARTVTSLLVIEREDLTRIAEEQPHIGYKLVMKTAKMISQRLRMTSGALVEAVCHPEEEENIE